MAERQTRNGWIYEKVPGGWQKVGPAQSGPPQDPTFDLQRPEKIADIENIRARTAAIQRGNDINEQRLGLDERRLSRESRQNVLSKEDQAFINAMREQAAGMPELAGKLTTATKAIDRFKPGPGRGAAFNLTYPEANDGVAASLFKGLGRQVQGDESERDYQTLRAMQESAVLKTQEAQKGPQTEADAARMKASTISPTLDRSVNAQLAAEALFNAKMAETKPDFFTKWANRHGSLAALDKDGQSVDQAWSRSYQRRFDKLRSDPRYSRLTGSGGKTQRAGGEFLGWED